MPDHVLLLIPGLPLLAAILIALMLLFGQSQVGKGERLTARIALLAALLSLLLVIALDVTWVIAGGVTRQISVLPWLKSGVYAVAISLTVDSLSLTFATLIAFISLLVMRFSVNYLHREAGFKRFFMVLCLFITAMQIIALSGNALLTFVGWELVGASSYLLIAYNLHNKTATTNATRAFVTNRLGDAGFLLSLFMGFQWFGSLEWPVLLTLHPNMSGLLLGVTALGFVGAAIIKSGQFPFSAWIVRAMEGPTPSSGIFYGAIMVHAGIYLLLRIHPLLEQIPELQYLLILVGVLTVLYGWLGAQVQTDIKTSLMFSTLSQTGLMLVSIGLGWYTLVLVHVVLHAIWRTYQFLYSPSFAVQIEWQAAPALPTWVRKRRWLYNAIVQRFWIDPLIDWLLVKPTEALAQEAQVFDGHILDKLSGSPSHNAGISSLAQMQALQQGTHRLEQQVGVGSGVLGKLMQSIAEHMEWLEQHLLMQHEGGRANRALDTLGRYLDRIERLLIQPRYLVLLVAITLVVIF